MTPSATDGDLLDLHDDFLRLGKATRRVAGQLRVNRHLRGIPPARTLWDGLHVRVVACRRFRGQPFLVFLRDFPDRGRCLVVSLGPCLILVELNPLRL